MRKFVVFFGATLWVAIAGNSSAACSPTCCFPGICSEPEATFKKVLPIKPRQQWNIEGGFCGSLSVQILMMGHGAWVSEDLIRKANIGAACFGHQETGEGCEVGPENYAATAEGLRLRYDVWNYTHPKPQAKAFKAWIKSHLVQGSPVMWAPMEKGEYPHQPYGPASTPGGGRFDHHEPIVGIGSNHDFSDRFVYDDDWILHYSNQDLMPYYRRFDSLEDGLHMDGNCQNASTEAPGKEAFPCFYNQVTYGLAVNGLNINVPTLPVYIDVDFQEEPNVRLSQKPIPFHASASSTPNLLYGSGAWTMTAERERKLKTAQRRMLRWMLGSVWRRRDTEMETETVEGDTCSERSEQELETDTEEGENESWIQWIKRCTTLVEGQLGKAGIQDWIKSQRRRMWRLAGHTARRDDGRWSEAVMGWQPRLGNRSRGHPRKRWSDPLDHFFTVGDSGGSFKNYWKIVAQNRQLWAELEEEFVAKAWYR